MGQNKNIITGIPLDQCDISRIKSDVVVIITYHWVKVVLLISGSWRFVSVITLAFPRIHCLMCL